MVKKMIVLAMMLSLAVLGASAQKLDGKWYADQAFKNLFELDEDSLQMDCVLTFDGQKIEIAMEVSESDPEIGTIKMAISLPGTYKRSGNTVTTAFEKNDLQFDIVDIQSNDPEMQELMKEGGDTRQLIVSIVKDAVKESNKEEFGQIGELADVFKQFDIVSVTDQKLVIEVEDTKLGFDRK